MSINKIIALFFSFLFIYSSDAQYFKPLSRYMRTSGYPSVDKTVFLLNDTSEKYNVIRYFDTDSKHSRVVELQINDSIIYFRLPNNQDSGLKISFNLNLDVGDTMEIDRLNSNSNLDFYYLIGQTMLFYKQKIRIDSIKTTNYSVGKLKTWYLNDGSIFVDSIGFIRKQGYIRESPPYTTFLYSCVKDNFVNSEDTSIKDNSDFCNYDTFFSRFHFDDIDKIQFARYNAFPNPFQDRLVVENLNIDNGSTFTVLDVLGHVMPIDGYETENNSTTLILKSLESGVYTLMISQKDGIHSIFTYLLLLKE